MIGEEEVPESSVRWSSPQERIFITLIHWGIVLVVVVATALLSIDHDLDPASTTALFGTVLGHAGTAAGQKLSTRT